MNDYTPQPDPLAPAITAQVRELHEHLQRLDMLTPPPELPPVSEAQARRAAADLRAALSRTVETLATVPQGSPLAHFSNALLYGGMVAAELQRIEPRPIACLTALAVWAAEFRRDTLPPPSAEALDALESDGEVMRFILQQLDPRERGAVLGATVVMDSATAALTDPTLTRPDYLQALDGAARILHLMSTFDDTPSAAQA